MGRWTLAPDRCDFRARVPSTGEAIIGEALQRVASSASAWLAADLAREIATLVSADAAASAAELVALIDELTADAAGHCVELHSVASAGTACRRDGRPITKHVVDRQLTTTEVWRQEALRAAVDEWEHDHARPLLVAAVPADVSEAVANAKQAIANLSRQRPEAARRVLDDWGRWTAALRSRLDPVDSVDRMRIRLGELGRQQGPSLGRQ